MKLTKADIDKVRHIEGFPIAKDEDIIALSRPPYYTACPNPFIEDFIRENGTPYDEATDDYHREPFAADVSEGKNDPIYMAHSYHTKVPYKAIMRYILHYTKPGDIVFDGFCGTGMTGVAAQMCGQPDNQTKAQFEYEMPQIQWGSRNAILNDLSPTATLIAHSYNSNVDCNLFRETAKKLLHECEQECSWMYETTHVDEKGHAITGIDGKPMKAKINYVVWSDVFICPSCANEFVFWDVAVDIENKCTRDSFICPTCNCELKKKDCEHAKVSYFDTVSQRIQTVSKQMPVMINYSIGKKRFDKTPDVEDISLISRIDAIAPEYWIPCDEMPEGYNTEQPKKSHGFSQVHQFFTQRNVLTISTIFNKLQFVPDTLRNQFLNAIRSSMSYSTKFVKVNVGRLLTNGGLFSFGAVTGTLYIPSLMGERPILDAYASKIESILKIMTHQRRCIVSTGSATAVTIPDNSVDYIFTDPPFGGNSNYSELNFIWESWLKVKTNNAKEAIINVVQKKGLIEYQALMESAFKEYYRTLKPNHWMTVEFHNSQNSIWNAISEALMRAGFIVADIRVLDKKGVSFQQATSSTAVKQDLVISAYKPKESFVREFSERAGDTEMAWEFIRQHLSNVPVVADGNHDGKLDIIAERQDYLLFDRMVAYHIMNGIPVPMDAHTFYDGLRQRFLQRDGMFFLPDQVNEYDEKRAHMELDTQQLSFVVTDEKNAIAWLNYILGDGAKTYQEIQPLYLQELHQSKQEKMPELLDMLRENFVQDDKGAWYVPDLSNAADLAKVRRKALLKEFYDSCVPGKGKLKVFRMEAIRAGFDECWKTRDFKTIVAVGERLPESVLQEDPALLMYYDNACSRV